VADRLPLADCVPTATERRWTGFHETGVDELSVPRPSHSRVRAALFQALLNCDSIRLGRRPLANRDAVRRSVSVTMQRDSDRSVPGYIGSQYDPGVHPALAMRCL